MSRPERLGPKRNRRTYFQCRAFPSTSAEVSAIGSSLSLRGFACQPYDFTLIPGDLTITLLETPFMLTLPRLPIHLLSLQLDGRKANELASLLLSQNGRRC